MIYRVLYISGFIHSSSINMFCCSLEMQDAFGDIGSVSNLQKHLRIINLRKDATELPTTSKSDSFMRAPFGKCLTARSKTTTAPTRQSPSKLKEGELSSYAYHKHL